MLSQSIFRGQQKLKQAKIFCLGIALLGLVACGTEVDQSEDVDQAEAEDQGDLILSYEATDNKNFKAIRKALKETAFFDDLIADINDNLMFATDISVVFASCGEANAYYDPEASEITMCYELIADYVSIFEDEIETEEDFANEVIDASSFTFESFKEVML